ncbi:MAG: exodeoxyribonuclease III [Gammaproteobacteria bacterium]
MTTVATWNVNSIRARAAHLERWLEESAVDIVALQETKVQDDAFPHDALNALGYTCAAVGQKSYNGVAVLSRRPLEVVASALPGFDDPQARVLAVAVDDFVLLDLYVPNGSAVGSDKYAYKLAWLDALAEWVETLLAAHPALLVVGDFNIAPADADVHDPGAWHEKVLCSSPERERLERLLGLGLSDVFRAFEQPPESFSWWDYRQAAFRRNLGLRIDLILASAPLAARIDACHIDRTPRGWEKPSDHAPVVARLDANA